MTITELLHPKKREITSGTKEWADYNVNCCKGCSNDCRYCYAKIIAKRFHRCNEDTWKKMLVNVNSVARNYGKYKGRVMFPSTHDITEEPEVLTSCTTVIDKLLASGNELLITTKPKLSVIEEITKKFSSFKAQIQFRFTITSCDNRLLSFWEPNAPSYEERFESLKYSYENGFKTSVSIEPFLDESPQNLIDPLSKYTSESIWVGPMNYIPRNGIKDNEIINYIDIRLKYEYSNLIKIYEDLRNFDKIRFKDSFITRISHTRELET